MQDEEPIWLIWSAEHRAWWRPARCGYTLIIEQAGRYPKRIADEICEQATWGGQVNEFAVLAPEHNERVKANG